MPYHVKKQRAIGLRGRHVLVIGMAREGMALARYLVGQGAHVVATDVKPLTAYADGLESLAQAGVELAMGGHSPHLLDACEIAFVSPGVPFESQFLEEARARGVPLSTESRLFCFLCPAPILGITGSSGKTTTTALTAEMLRVDGRRVRMGGNIGQPLIEMVNEIDPDEWVVMELSSFQLEYFHPSANSHVLAAPDGKVRELDPFWMPLLCGWSPHVGAILNITPNHLDRHPSMDAYVHAKRAIIQYRQPDDVAVMGLDNDISRRLGATAAGRVRWFSRSTRVDDGACLERQGDDLKIFLRRPGEESLGRTVCSVSEIRLRGEHNVSNVLAACAIADTVGVSPHSMHQVASTFSGVPHRLELVADRSGVSYYNDSIATSPERLVAALKAFDEPIILLAGGRDKHLPWHEAARLMLQRTRHVLLFGEAADMIEEALAAAAQAGPDGKTPSVRRCQDLAEAVAVAHELAVPGDVVLLSPGCTSFDQFQDFAERGDRFRQLVLALKKKDRAE